MDRLYADFCIISLISAIVEKPKNLSSSTIYPLSFNRFDSSFRFFSLSLSFKSTNLCLLFCCLAYYSAAANSCPEGLSDFRVSIYFCCFIISLFKDPILDSRFATYSYLQLR